MKEKLTIETENILNRCTVHAKIGGDNKLSSYNVTLRVTDVEALGIQRGDLLDLAVLNIHHPENKGRPNTSPAIQQVESVPSALGLEEKPVTKSSTPVQEHLVLQESPQEEKSNSPGQTHRKRVTKGGKRGSSKRGKRGVKARR